ncbi:GTPase domain-containing protein [Myceligenerans salitolerans]|uniref:GTPase domain-containing protein n=1 Tax=Myceligenerans salitolerans TaxID=1230528 RepID=A0ABS3I5A6_9MICO|nr:GTPase domain-containing protein [Myceligenerans salitolerans]MBO0607801.1 GTPase domain-containing protein [Myceligenerans salitolerans]
MTLGTRSAALGRRGGVDPDVAEQLGFTVHDVVQDLRGDIAAVRLPLPIEGAEEAEASRARLLAQLDEHLLPRLAELSSPALVVLAGSTGAGKSTIFNSLLRGDISDAGVLRPTTREPVVGVHPRDRVTLKAGPVTELARVVEHEGVPRGTALLDAPDLDSFVSQNRSTAGKLLEGADLWLFVTTAARYGDALPWEALDRARERGASVAIVLNRVGEDDLATIRGDLNARMRERGMTDAPLFVIPDVGPHEGLLESRLVAGIGRWLAMMAGPERSRTVVVRTLKGALKALPDWVDGLVDAVDAQGAAARELRRVIDVVVPDAEAVARAAITAGTAGGSQVTARFAELVASRRIDRVTMRDGVVRATRRAGRARSEALAPLREEARKAAERSISAAGARTEERLRAELAGPGAPAAGAAVAPSGKDRGQAREEWAAEQASAWVAESDRLVAALGGAEEAPGEEPPVAVDEEAVLGARRAFGDAGLATLLLAAALGNDDAARLLGKVLGDAVDTLVRPLRADLADRTALAVAAEARSVQSALEIPALADDAAATLRVRLAELRRLT